MRLSTCHLMLPNQNTVFSHMGCGPCAFLVLYTNAMSTSWKNISTRGDTVKKLEREQQFHTSTASLPSPTRISPKLQFQLDCRLHNNTTNAYIQLKLYWHPVNFKIRVLLGFLFYTSSRIQLQGAYFHGIMLL